MSCLRASAVLGLKRIGQCTLTRNRNVMVSFRGNELRVHQGYLAAPRDVHQAIVTFVEGRTRAERRIAQRRIVSFAGRDAARPGAPRAHASGGRADRREARRMARALQRASTSAARSRAIPVRVSRRMKSRLGHYTAAARTAEPGEIAISWRHLRRHGWQEALRHAVARDGASVAGRNEASDRSRRGVSRQGARGGHRRRRRGARRLGTD